MRSSCVSVSFWPNSTVNGREKAVHTSMVVGARRKLYGYRAASAVHSGSVYLTHTVGFRMENQRGEGIKMTTESKQTQKQTNQRKTKQNTPTRQSGQHAPAGIGGNSACKVAAPIHEGHKAVHKLCASRVTVQGIGCRGYSGAQHAGEHGLDDRKRPTCRVG
jgi:hypothetical protein